ncbi:plasmid pRiA4b ORF-3 family protein [Mesoterricola silvestris]|uniref:Plasmid pRiA4b Orf3-like domain-containing protein n=1 Tax=Mesoterricola silvestris TaxID=2927979 RepID=A0AA48KDI6_9BACT|nr:plasmid pRiA4b ORF-3 family protein [Mesoterricola silvestris]BDU74498.1 hypothetical protein METEAL_36720 [Mesoterricola silvestris]
MHLKDPRDAFQLKILLADTRPPVWRRLQVPASLSLARLHRAIQAAFGWEDDHGHVFRIRGGEYGRSGSEDAFDLRGERVSLAGLGVEAGDAFHYEYDFEDAWSHLVTVEARLLLEAPLGGPICLGGRRACPPEGSGGPFAFQASLAAAQDPSHPEHGQARACFPRGWKAEAFDLRAAQRALGDI